MGNVQDHQTFVQPTDNARELNIGRKLNRKQYLRHVKGDVADSALVDVPWSLRDSVCFYEIVNISFHNLADIPEEMPWRLPHLKKLLITHNKLSTLPDTINLFFHLETMNLSHNDLEVLPKTFTKLQFLHTLDLTFNDIRTLPEDMGNMEKLCKLNVSNNKLKSLPLSLGRSKTLKILLVKKNRLSRKVQELCNRGSSAILEFLRDEAERGSTPSPVSLNVNHFERTDAKSNILGSAEYAQAQAGSSNTDGRIKTPLVPPLGATTRDVRDLRDRILGLLYGAAIGDALGVSTEFMTPDECEFHYDRDTFTYSDIVRDEHRTRWKLGDWTSNFDQIALLLETLVRWSGVFDELEFAKTLKSWTEQGFKDFGEANENVASNTLARVVAYENYEQKPHAVSEILLAGRASDEPRQFADNAAACRFVITGLVHFHDLEEVTSNALRMCRATHADERCCSVAVFLSRLVALILQNRDILESQSSRNGLLSECLVAAQNCVSDDYSTDVESMVHDRINEDISDPATSHYVLTTGAVATYVVKSCLDFRPGFMDVILLGGAGAANGCVAGALLGLINGYTRLPPEWIEGLLPKQRTWLNVKINALLDLMAIP